MYEGENDGEMQEKAEEERRQIVAKYKAGAKRAVVDEWEDPGALEVYHMQDRYGFIHDTRLPDTKDRTDRERKQMALENARELKWVEMVKKQPIKYFGEKAKLREKMINRVFKGRFY